MATKSSKWATDDDNQASAEALTQRKKEKEQRKRLKEEKARKAAEQAVPPADAVDTNERPSKRQRTSPENEDRAPAAAANGEVAIDGANLLQFPTNPIGPCGHVDQFEQLNNIEEGSYGLVSRARRKTSGTLVALKKLKMEHTSDGFPVTGLREIQTLKASLHANVVHLQEVVMGDSLKE